MSAPHFTERAWTCSYVRQEKIANYFLKSSISGVITARIGGWLGLAIGVGVTWAATRALASRLDPMLFEVDPGDPRLWLTAVNG